MMALDHLIFEANMTSWNIDAGWKQSWRRYSIIHLLTSLKSPNPFIQHEVYLNHIAQLTP